MSNRLVGIYNRQPLRLCRKSALRLNVISLEPGPNTRICLMCFNTKFKFFTNYVANIKLRVASNVRLLCFTRVRLWLTTHILANHACKPHRGASPNLGRPQQCCSLLWAHILIKQFTFAEQRTMQRRHDANAPKTVSYSRRNFAQTSALSAENKKVWRFSKMGHRITYMFFIVQMFLNVFCLY